MDDLAKLLNIIKNSKNLVFFGGAGVSVASGIPDFRGAEGLYNYTPEDIISHSFFLSNTSDFYKFYFDKMVYNNAMPNECHYALAELEKKGILKAIVTQNIDGLHQKASSKNVYELHGSVKRNYCMKCNKFYSIEDISLDVVPKCSCGGVIKPDVVLYEEPLDESITRLAVEAISKADTLIIAGTSLVVYPAASFVRYFRGMNLIYINLGIDKTKLNSNLDALLIDGKIEDYLNRKNLKDANIIWKEEL